MTQRFLRLVAVAGVAALCLLSATAVSRSAELDDVKSVPHLDNSGNAAYLRFLHESPSHRAFALAPGGEWGLASGEAGPAEAGHKAIENCRRYSKQTCFLYAIDDKVVFDRAAFDRSWLDLSKTNSKSTDIGTETGKLFPDISFADANGGRMSLSDFRGKPVFLHFWGSWCSPCRVEFQQIQKLYKSLQAKDISFVLVQAREPILQSKEWAVKNGFDMPFFDSGESGKADTKMVLKTGQRMEDRDLAPGFPSTYILDREGRVLFEKSGPNRDWMEYLPLLAKLCQPK